jgi:hypothetical protein
VHNDSPLNYNYYTSLWGEVFGEKNVIKVLFLASPSSLIADILKGFQVNINDLDTSLISDEKK